MVEFPEIYQYIGFYSYLSIPFFCLSCSLMKLLPKSCMQNLGNN